MNNYLRLLCDNRDITDDNVLRRRDRYEYDYINQLRKVDLPGNRDLELEYDRHFNRQYMKHGFGVITYNYNVALNELLEYKEDTNGDGEYELGVEYSYDRQGNPTGKVYRDMRPGQNGRETAREMYTWNDRDELTKITGRVTESYVYDYRGLRHIKSNDNNTYKYIYLQNNQPALKENTNENYTDVFVYEGAKRIARVRVDGTGNTNTEVFINNYQGSPVVVLSSTGDIRYQKYLDPWGNMEMEIGVPSSDIEFQYTDKELDEETGLYNFWNRYRDPVDNRFYGRDRVHLEDKTSDYFKLNPYLYGKNNPLRYIDPDGLENKYVAKYGTRLTHYDYDKEHKEAAYANGINRLILSRRTIMVCNELLTFVYRGSGENDFPFYDYQPNDGSDPIKMIGYLLNRHGSKIMEIIFLVKILIRPSLE